MKQHGIGRNPFDEILESVIRPRRSGFFFLRRYEESNEPHFPSFRVVG